MLPGKKYSFCWPHISQRLQSQHSFAQEPPIEPCDKQPLREASVNDYNTDVINGRDAESQYDLLMTAGISKTTVELRNVYPCHDNYCKKVRV